MTFRYALSILEDQFDATYRGLCQPDYINHDERNDVWHRFETKVGADRIVNDNQIFQLANAYDSWHTVHYRLQSASKPAILTAWHTHANS